MTRRLTVDQVIAIHDDQVCNAPLLYVDRLDGALNAPFQSVFLQDAYPSLVEKAAKLLEGISRCHAFQEGNKRTAWLSCQSFLEANGLAAVGLDQYQAAEIMVEFTLNGDDIPEIAAWLNTYVDLI